LELCLKEHSFSDVKIISRDPKTGVPFTFYSYNELLFKRIKALNPGKESEIHILLDKKSIMQLLEFIYTARIEQIDTKAGLNLLTFCQDF